MKTNLEPDAIPYFSWDRRLTVRQITDLLRTKSGVEQYRLAAWIMREAVFDDVWKFLQPRWVRDHFDELAPLLGRKREFWKYILGMWHELGKL